MAWHPPRLKQFRENFMSSKWLPRAFGALAATGAASAGPAIADPVADFYKTNTVTVVLPIGPGGTYDFYGRLGAAIMEKHLPGKPKVITQLMTGAGGAKATNYMASVAPKNGTFLISQHASAPQNQVLAATGIRYDLSKFLMIGQFLPLNSSLTVWKPTSPALTIEDAKKKQVILGSTGRGSYQYQLPVLLNALIGTKFKIVLGYKSVSEENLAMERGEIHGRGGTTVSWAITQPSWIREDKIAHLIQVGAKRAVGFENVPLATELVTSQEAKQALTLVSGGALMGRSLAGTPGIPADRAKALRAAFDKGIKDTEIIAKAKDWKLDLEPVSGAELEKTVADILSTPPEVVKKVKQLLGSKGK
jgi:tripartite-type tricarboxylate transporter receptor subunit TctC